MSSKHLFTLLCSNFRASMTLSQIIADSKSSTFRLMSLIEHSYLTRAIPITESLSKRISTTIEPQQISKDIYVNTVIPALQRMYIPVKEINIFSEPESVSSIAAKILKNEQYYKASFQLIREFEKVNLKIDFNDSLEQIERIGVLKNIL